jgi:hypothetical protein
MLVAFFDNKGLVYSHIVLKESIIYAAYIVKVLDVFMKHLRKKRPLLVEQGWFFHWDNTPVHSAIIVQDWFTANSVQVLRNPPYLPDLALADFFLFRPMKDELAGITFDHSTLKRSGKGSQETSPLRSSPLASGTGMSATESV